MNENKQSLDRPWKRLKAAREKAGYKTAQSFSDTLGIGQNTYNYHERPTRAEGGTGHKFDESAGLYASRLSETLSGVSAEWLLFGSDAAEPPLELIGPAPTPPTPDGVRSESQAAYIDQHGRPDRNVFISHSNLDTKLMADVITRTAIIMAKHDLVADPNRVADLYLAVYELAADDIKDHGAWDPADFLHVIKLAS